MAKELGKADMKVLYYSNGLVLRKTGCGYCDPDQIIASGSISENGAISLSLKLAMARVMAASRP
jgi:hypothetical protein